MALPFSHDAFLDVFGAYNAAWWPFALLLWIATLAAAYQWLTAGRFPLRALYLLLAVHWAWSGIVYHWWYFQPINPAAALFGAGFVIQAVIFGWLAVVSRGDASLRRDARSVVAGLLVFYGLLYPLVGLSLGLQFPRLPLFAVPCPTALVTAGWLVGTKGVPRLANVWPLAWSVIGSSAAFALGIRADLALVIAAAALAFNIARRRETGTSTSTAAHPPELAVR
jgi:hypothetical protein